MQCAVSSPCCFLKIRFTPSVSFHQNRCHSWNQSEIKENNIAMSMSQLFSVNSTSFLVGVRKFSRQHKRWKFEHHFPHLHQLKILQSISSWKYEMYPPWMDLNQEVMRINLIHPRDYRRDLWNNSTCNGFTIRIIIIKSRSSGSRNRAVWTCVCMWVGDDVN